MMNFENISPKKENKPKIIRSESGLTRREVLLSAAALGSLAALGGVKKLFESDKPTDISPEEQIILDEKIAEVQKRSEPTEQQTKISKVEDEMIGKTFKQQLQENNYISLDAQTKRAIYKHWHDRYSPGGSDYGGGLIEGLNRMKPWIDEIKEIFDTYGIPQEYIFLAIPESHFDVNAISTAKDPAVGAYQITSHTAKLKKLKMNMHITKSYDERRDPIKSAELCAKHLKYSYERFGRDWSFALMDYNGGFTNDYLEYIKETEKTIPLEIRDEVHTLQDGETLSAIAIKYNTSVQLLQRANNISNEEIKKLGVGRKLRLPQERDLSLTGFNDWLEDRINDEISDTKFYIVEPSDTLTKIQNETGVSIDDIMSANNLTDTVVKIGQKLRLPPPAQTPATIKRKLNSISQFSENINYPEKFFAIHDIIKSEKLDTILNNPKRSYKTVDMPKKNMTEFNHTVKRGDTVRGLVLQVKRKYPQLDLSIPTLMGMFRNTHNLDTKYTIQLNQKLTISFPVERPATLIDISKKYNVSIELLQQMNPAILVVESELPESTQIRIPKS